MFVICKTEYHNGSKHENNFDPRHLESGFMQKSCDVCACFHRNSMKSNVKSMLAEKHAMKIRLSRNAIPREVSLTLNVFFAKIFSTRKKHSGIERKEKRRCDNEVAR